MSGIRCAQCGAELAADARFCHHCGHSVGEPVGCVSCGASLDADASFCPECGAAVGDEPAEGAAPPKTVTPPPDPADRPKGSPAALIVVGALVLIAVAAAWSFTRGGHPDPPRPPMTEITPESTPPGAPPATVGSASGAARKMPPAGMGGGMPPAGMGGGMPPAGMGGGMPPAGMGGGMPPAGMGGGTPPAGMGGGMPPAGMGGGMPPAGMGGAMGAGGEAPKGEPITGTVEVLPALAKKVKPGSVIFLIARPATGPPTPIAVAKLQLATFPVPFVIGPADSMGGSWGGEMRISARLDQDGHAMSKTAGDLYGEAKPAPVKPGATEVKIVLDTAL